MEKIRVITVEWNNGFKAEDQIPPFTLLHLSAETSPQSFNNIEIFLERADRIILSEFPLTPKPEFILALVEAHKIVALITAIPKFYESWLAMLKTRTDKQVLAVPFIVPKEQVQ